MDLSAADVISLQSNCGDESTSATLVQLEGRTFKVVKITDWLGTEWGPQELSELSDDELDMLRADMITVASERVLRNTDQLMGSLKGWHVCWERKLDDIKSRAVVDIGTIDISCKFSNLYMSLNSIFHATPPVSIRRFSHNYNMWLSIEIVFEETKIAPNAPTSRLMFFS